MKDHVISADNFGDSYMLSYGPGCMGDFLASLILHSFKKNFFPEYRYDAPDTFNYEPWSKKWVVRDSTNNELRRFLLAREQAPPINNIASLSDLVKKFNLKITKLKTETELASFLEASIDDRKVHALPFFFVSETLSVYAQTATMIQRLPGMTVIEAQFFEEKYKPLYAVLSFYKHKLYGYENHRRWTITREKFITYFTKVHISVENKFKDIKKYHKIDMLKLVLEEDLQGLDMISANDIDIKNMISVARRDMFEILDFFELDLNNLPKFTLDKINELYDRLEMLN